MVKTLPSLADVFVNLEEIEVKGVKLKVVDVNDEEVIFASFPEKTTFVLDNGEVIDSNEWFERYIASVSGEVDKHEVTGKDTPDPISEDERGESEAELLPDGNAGERQDDVSLALSEEDDFDAKR